MYSGPVGRGSLGGGSWRWWVAERGKPYLAALLGEYCTMWRCPTSTFAESGHVAARRQSPPKVGPPTMTCRAPLASDSDLHVLGDIFLVFIHLSGKDLDGWMFSASIYIDVAHSFTLQPLVMPEISITTTLRDPDIARFTSSSPNIQ